MPKIKKCFKIKYAIKLKLWEVIGVHRKGKDLRSLNKIINKTRNKKEQTGQGDITE